MNDNVIKFPRESGYEEVFTFMCGATVTIKILPTEPPLTVAQAIYLLDNCKHQIHRMMEPRE